MMMAMCLLTRGAFNPVRSCMAGQVTVKIEELRCHSRAESRKGAVKLRRPQLGGACLLQQIVPFSAHHDQQQWRQTKDQVRLPCCLPSCVRWYQCCRPSPYGLAGLQESPLVFDSRSEKLLELFMSQGTSGSAVPHCIMT